MEAAANDLIDMLLDTEEQVSKEDEKSVVPSGEKRVKNTGKKIVLYCIVLLGVRFFFMLVICVGGHCSLAD